MPAPDSLGDSFRAVAVAVWVFSTRHVEICLGIGEQLVRFRHDAFTRHADDLGQAELRSFRTFRHFAQHQHRLLEGRRFFLNTAGVSEDQVAPLQQADESRIVEWLDEVNPLGTLQ